MADPKKTRGLRFGDEQWDLIVDEARHAGVNPSQYVREAVYAHALISRVARQRSLGSAAQFIAEAVRRDLGPDLLDSLDKALQRVEEDERQSRRRPGRDD